MMDAKELNERFVDYLYGELDGQQKEAFEEGLRRHPELRLELQALERTRLAFAELEPLEPPAAITDSLLEEAAARVPGGQKPALLTRLHQAMRLLVLHPAVAAAAMLVLVVGVSLYVYQRAEPSTAIDQDVVDEATVSHAAPTSPLESGTSERRATETPAAKAQEELRGGSRATPDESAALQKGGSSAGPTAYSGAARAENKAIGVPSPRDKYDRKDERAGRKTALGWQRSDGELDRILERPRKKAPRWSTHKRVRKPSTRALAGGSGDNVKGKATQGPAEDVGALASQEPEPQAAQRAVAPRPAAPGQSRGTQRAGSVAKTARMRRQYAQPPPPVARRPYESSTDRKSNAEARRNAAMIWVKRALLAAKRNNCAEALAYYQQAVRASQEIAPQVERRLGNCATVLAQNRGRYPVLARSMDSVRRARQRKAKSAPTGRDASRRAR